MVKALWNDEAPGVDLDMARMPGHWLLARLGKRVLRPGGRELTESMLDALAIGAEDEVVELAPGLGHTAQMVIERGPAAYTGVDRDQAAVQTVGELVGEASASYVARQGTAEDTGLAADGATVVFGEAMLTMQTATKKRRIVEEAYRILRPGGHYGIHELCLCPDDLADVTRDEIETSLRETIRVGARPLTTTEWSELLEDARFEVEVVEHRPMHLLEPQRLVADEGMLGAARFMFNVATSPSALRRVTAMRACFRRYEQYMGSISIIARKM